MFHEPLATRAGNYVAEMHDVAEFIEEVVSASGGKDIAYAEGKTHQIYTHRRERSAAARAACLAFFTDYRCCICRINFEEEYGKELGEGFIHVHHIEAFEDAGERSTRPPNDLRLVCPNCHAMLHRGRNRSIEEVRSRREAAVRNGEKRH